MAGIIAIVVVMVIINAFMVYAVVGAWERVDEKINRFFLDRTSSFMLKGTQDSSTEEKVVEQPKETVIIKTQPVYVAPNTVSNTVYKSKEFKDEYKNLKEVMSFNKDEVISKVLIESEQEISTLGQTAINLKNTFSFDTIFKLSTLSPTEQEDVLRTSFNKDENALLDEYISNKSNAFSAVEFFDYVGQIAKTEDPNFYVKTGWKSDNFNDLGDKVVTVHDNDITEGVKIVHKNKLYDYSV